MCLVLTALHDVLSEVLKFRNSNVCLCLQLFASKGCLACSELASMLLNLLLVLSASISSLMSVSCQCAPEGGILAPLSLAVMPLSTKQSSRCPGQSLCIGVLRAHVSKSFHDGIRRVQQQSHAENRQGQLQGQFQPSPPPASPVGQPNRPFTAMLQGQPGIFAPVMLSSQPGGQVGMRCDPQPEKTLRELLWNDSFLADAPFSLSKIAHLG